MRYQVAHFSITTDCNMSCPQCCYGMRWRPARHAPLAELMEDVLFFKGLREITVTGGEPTYHPQFGDVVTGIKYLLPEIELRVETNGLLYQKWGPEIFNMFNLINVTHYTKEAWDGCLDNTKMVEKIAGNHKNVRVMLAKHIEMKPGKGSNPCGRQERPQYSQRKVYGCCLYPGVFGSEGIPLTEDWQEKLQAVRLRCENCPYGV